MAFFEYSGYDNSGKEIKGVIEASSRNEARTLLQNSGVFPSELRDRGDEVNFSGGFYRISKQALASVFRQLATFLESGFPLVQALTAVAEQTDNRNLRMVITDLRKKVSEGQHLSQALGAYEKIFPPIFINMVRAGESSGSLENVVGRIAELTEKQVAFRNRIRSVLAYPVLVGIIGVCIAVFLLFVVLPSLTQIFVDMGQALPLPTRILISFGDAVFRFWWLIVLAVLTAVIALAAAAAAERGRVALDGAKLKFPVMGAIYLKSSTSRFCRTLGTVIASGVPILTSIDIARNVLGNEVMSRAVEKVRQEVKEGESITGPLRKENIFPLLALRYMAAGEESGNLTGMLFKVADVYDSEVEARITMLSSLLEPVMIIIMGMVVGFVALGILLPIFEMSQVIR